MNVQLLIPAAGAGVRLGCAGPKALVELAGKPLLVRSLERFEPLGLAKNAVIICPPGLKNSVAEALAPFFPEAQFTLCDGGDERQKSVENGLASLHSETEIVVIHDAARPFVPIQAVRESISTAEEYGAASVAIPSIDTIFEADLDQFLVQTPDRRRLWACQTPQTFRVEVIRNAHATARAESFLGTDDASLVRRAGGSVKLVMGSMLNFKITTPMDLALAHCVVEKGLADPC